MVASSPILEVLGLPQPERRLYERVRELNGRSVDAVATSLGVDVAEARRQIEPLVRAGAVEVGRDGVTVRSDLELVHVLLTRWTDDMAHTQSRLDTLAGALGVVNAARSQPAGHDVVGPLDGEVSRGGDRVALISDLIARTTGDLLWFRPDQFRPSGPDPIMEIVAAAAAEGRGSRAVYPARVLHEAPHTLERRARVGEEARLVPDVPTRMLVVGTTHAVLPEPIGCVDEPRVLVRQRSLVQACTLLFDAYWERGAAFTELHHGVARPDLRRFVLEQLALGAQDEQIARSLGVSLRTVRRRVADLMADLGADTRFQAGAEAVRRGWL